MRKVNSCQIHFESGLSQSGVMLSESDLAKLRCCSRPIKSIMSEKDLKAEVILLRAALARSEYKLFAAEEALDHRQRQIDAMRATADALFAKLSPDEMLRETIAMAIQVMRADGGSVMLYDAKEDVLVFRHVVGPAAERMIGLK